MEVRPRAVWPRTLSLAVKAYDAQCGVRTVLKLFGECLKYRAWLHFVRVALPVGQVPVRLRRVADDDQL